MFHPSCVSYGVGYGTEDVGCMFHVMSYGLDTSGLCDNLGKALADIKDSMEEATFFKTK